jgi:predicted RNA methylase
MQPIWSNSDFVYMCLRDQRRTNAFRAAIDEVVRPGDRVLEIGAGSGILSLFACAAGAANVTAVEIDPSLANLVAATARENGFDDRLTVITGDGQDVELPPVDVVIAELIDTGLLDELQVPVMNSLVERGVITDSTRVIPSGYRTEVQLVEVDEDMYGFKIKTLRHEWPFYGRDENWASVAVHDRSDRLVTWEGSFASGPHTTVVQQRLGFTVPGTSMVNGLRICGTAILSPRIEVGAHDSLNGDKIVPIAERTVGGRVDLDVSYEMGGGLGGLTARWLDG